MLREYLSDYPSTLRDYLVDGFTNGFSISNFYFESNDGCRNLKSASLKPDTVQLKLDKESSLGRIAGPFKSHPLKDMVYSPLGLQPKKLPGEFRVIHDLSFPRGGPSINSGIPRDMATVQYSSVPQAIQLIKHHGRFSYLAKTDIKSAFRIIPIRPDQYHLLGFQWNNNYYYDMCLPMGCSSSCSIFQSFSTSLEFIIRSKVTDVSIIHILDDFFFVSHSYQSCYDALMLFLDICKEIGVPMALDKTFGPYQSLPFAGIHLDSRDMSASLPEDKIIKFLSYIDVLLNSRTATLRQVQSVVGMLNFSCTVIEPARAFSRRLIDLTKGMSIPYHHLKITRQCKEDLKVWKEFLINYNRKTFFLDYKFISSPALDLYTDSCTSIGFGGYFKNNWFCGMWPKACFGLHISLLELYPIFLAFHLYSDQFVNRCICIHSDNIAVVHILNSCTSKDTLMMIMIRKLVLFCMLNNVYIKATHISGKNNQLADSISRFQMDQVWQLGKFLKPRPTPIPPELHLDRLLKL